MDRQNGNPKFDPSQVKPLSYEEAKSKLDSEYGHGKVNLTKEEYDKIVNFEQLPVEGGKTLKFSSEQRAQFKEFDKNHPESINIYE